MEIVHTACVPVPGYPKTDNLFSRNPDTKKCIPQIRRAEFAVVNRWRVTEKIDGMNIRIALLPDGRVFVGGRTDKAQLPPKLVEYIRDTLDPDPMLSWRSEMFPDAPVVIYGEGYGAGIQKGGAYASEPRFCGFDAMVGGKMLPWSDATELIRRTNLETAPDLGVKSLADTMRSTLGGRLSMIAASADDPPVSEGVIAVAEPQLYTRFGERVKFKLKWKDVRDSPGLHQFIQTMDNDDCWAFSVSDA